MVSSPPFFCPPDCHMHSKMDELLDYPFTGLTTRKLFESNTERIHILFGYEQEKPNQLANKLILNSKVFYDMHNLIGLVKLVPPGEKPVNRSMLQSKCCICQVNIPYKELLAQEFQQS